LHTPPHSSHSLPPRRNPRPFPPRVPRSTPRDSSLSCASSSALRAATFHPLALPSSPAPSTLPVNVLFSPSAPPLISAPSPRLDGCHRSFSALLAPSVNSWQPSRS